MRIRRKPRSPMPSRRKIQKIQVSQPHLHLWEGDGASILETTSRHIKDKKVAVSIDL